LPPSRVPDTEHRRCLAKAAAYFFTPAGLLVELCVCVSIRHKAPRLVVPFGPSLSSRTNRNKPTSGAVGAPPASVRLFAFFVFFSFPLFLYFKIVGKLDYSIVFEAMADRLTQLQDTVNQESSIELQVQSLQRLEAENKESAEKLEEIVRKGELLLEKIQAALSDIAQSQLDMQYSS
uniref:Mediator of RNA polymerase II transcription subunit 21 n=2 Tax=gambiae species complex TaxID=44542 RepID=A0A8W7Q314_ANOCL